MTGKGVNRREFIKAVGLAGGALALMRPVGIGPALAAETYTGVTYLTPAYKALMWGINGFNERLQKKAGDLFKVSFHDSGTLVKEDQQVQALRAGTIQYMFHTSSYITRSFKILGVTGLPSLVEVLYEKGERLKMETPLWKLINDSLAKEDMIMLTAGGGVLEPEYIWSGAGKKINSLGDLKGTRCRIVSYEATEALKAYGVAGTRIPSAETYLALQRGTVDALVANISTIMGRKLFEQLKYCYQLPITGFTISLFMLKSKWDKLDDKTKAAFWEASKWFDDNYAKTVNGKYYVEEYWPTLKKAGLEIVKPAQEELKNFEQSSLPVWEWWKKEVGPELGQKAIDLALGKA
ncbi:MAG: TRAP transporter substrate-binding protein DctP [Thermodesulfobacteriota bacterium]